MSYDYSKFKNLYNAQQQVENYNNRNNKKKVSDEARAALDVNGDGKIDNKDSTQLKTNVTTEQGKISYDITGDNKFDINDWLKFSTEADVDGDGTVSSGEKKFLEAQKILVERK